MPAGSARPKGAARLRAWPIVVLAWLAVFAVVRLPAGVRATTRWTGPASGFFVLENRSDSDKVVRRTSSSCECVVVSARDGVRIPRAGAERIEFEVRGRIPEGVVPVITVAWASGGPSYCFFLEPPG